MISVTLAGKEGGLSILTGQREEQASKSPPLGKEEARRGGGRSASPRRDTVRGLTAKRDKRPRAETLALVLYFHEEEERKRDPGEARSEGTQFICGPLHCVSVRRPKELHTT